MKPGNVGPRAGQRLRIHPVLCSAPLELTYDFQTATGRLVMADGHCADKDAVIALFAAIDPGVGVIVTFSGLDKDAVYMRHGQGWQAESRPRR